MCQSYWKELSGESRLRVEREKRIGECGRLFIIFFFE